MKTTIHNNILKSIVRVSIAAFAVAFSAAEAQTGSPSSAPFGLTQYQFGKPSGDETEILQLVNRSRANPAAEGPRLVADNPPGDFSSQAQYQAFVDEILASFGSYPTRAPLAFNADLNASAQAHVADMIKTGVQQHNSSDGTSAEQRIISFGYSTPAGENIAGAPHYSYPYLLTPWDIEIAYETDLNNVEPGYGHRLNIMEPSVPEEVEIGIAQQMLGGWNTQDFGMRGTPPLLTGVVFTDNAGTGFYASGEGVSGVTVTAPGFSSYYAVTGVGGAYTLPLDLAGPVYTLGAAYTYDTNTGKYVYSPVNPAPVVNVTFTDSQGNTTTSTVTLTYTVEMNPAIADPTTGFTGVLPTYADSNGVPRWDNSEVDWVKPSSGTYSLTPLRIPFFLGETNLSNGARYLAFPDGSYFGYYSVLPDSNYLYHFDLGYEYVFNAYDSKGGVYLYDFTSKTFFYTSPTFSFPYLYDFTLNTVLYYYPDPNNAGHYNTNGVRYFYNFATGKIITK